MIPAKYHLNIRISCQISDISSIVFRSYETLLVGNGFVYITLVIARCSLQPPLLRPLVCCFFMFPVSPPMLYTRCYLQIHPSFTKDTTYLFKFLTGFEPPLYPARLLPKLLKSNLRLNLPLWKITVSSPANGCGAK